MKKSGRARVCDFCSKRSETKLRACGKCKFVFYRDAACQRKAWPAHKRECGERARPLVPRARAQRVEDRHAARGQCKRTSNANEN